MKYGINDYDTDDCVGRGKLSSKSEAMESRCPHCNAIVTAESPMDIGESGAARYFTVEMTLESLYNSFLTIYREVASKQTFNTGMYAFVEYNDIECFIFRRRMRGILDIRELTEKK